MKRIFVAVDISEGARRKAAAYVENLRNEFSTVRVGWDKPEKMHLTLKFLGDTDETQLRGLEQIVSNIAAEFSKFEIRILRTGAFPNERNPRVLWLDVKDETGNLSRLNDRLEAACEELGFERERRKFVPHLTIGRVREPGSAKELAKKHLENSFEPVEFEISEIVIIESKLLPSGSIYSVVSKHALE